MIGVRRGGVPGAVGFFFEGVGDMFAKFVKVSESKRKAVVSIPQTEAFVTAVTSEGIRLSYGALSLAALALGEVKPSGQSAGQRGASLVKVLPEVLQHMVCRGGNPDSERHGTYHRKALESWKLDPREDLLELPVMGKDEVIEAVKIWQEGLVSSE